MIRLTEINGAIPAFLLRFILPQEVFFSRIPIDFQYGMEPKRRTQ